MFGETCNVRQVRSKAKSSNRITLLFAVNGFGADREAKQRRTPIKEVIIPTAMFDLG